MQRISALVIPPGWKDVWISPDPLGHIQATGVDSRGRTQYLYHELWREQRDAQKFAHMLRFAAVLPALRTATVRDLRHRYLDRDRVTAGAVRLIDLGLFRIGGEKYATLAVPLFLPLALASLPNVKGNDRGTAKSLSLKIGGQKRGRE